VTEEKEKHSEEKTCHSATLSATNPTWINLGSHRDNRGKRPATHRLSHGRDT